jgi:hypothetical protein
MRDFSKNQSATPGDPTAWLRGLHEFYGRLWDRLAERGKQYVLVAEYMNESLLPSLHGGLSVSPALVRLHRPVPLFQAIYHSHLASVGWAENPSLLRHAPEEYLHQRLVPLVYGSQLGWISYVLPDLVEKHPAVTACFAQAVALRKQYPELLGYGRLLRPPVVHDVPQRTVPTNIKSDSPLQPHPWPSVLTGLFGEHPTPQRALLVLANWTANPQAGRVSVDLHSLGDGPWTARWPDGRTETINDTDATLTFEIKPMSVVGVLIEKGNTRP